MSFHPHAIQLAEIITELQKMDSVDLETVLEGVISRGEREILILTEGRFKP